MFCENGKKSLAFSLPRNGLHRLRLRDIKSWSWWRGCFQIDRADVAGAALSRTLRRESDSSRAPTGSSFPFPSPFDRAHLHGESHREIQSPATSRKTFLLSSRWLSKKVYSKIILSALIVRSLYIEITCLSNTRLRIFFLVVWHFGTQSCAVFFLDLFPIRDTRSVGSSKEVVPKCVWPISREMFSHNFGKKLASLSLRSLWLWR